MIVALSAIRHKTYKGKVLNEDRYNIDAQIEIHDGQLVYHSIHRNSIYFAMSSQSHLRRLWIGFWCYFDSHHY